MVWQARLVRAGRDGVWRGLAGEAGHGEAWQGLVRQATQSQERRVRMTYEWKLPGIMPVSAQTAGEELDRIYEKYGQLDAKSIVDESREEDSPLHPCFEWRDNIAAEKYRESQAREIVRCITVKESSVPELEHVRAFVRVEQAYHPISVVISDEDKMIELLHTALSELQSFKRKYGHLSKLKQVFDAIDDLTA